MSASWYWRPVSGWSSLGAGPSSDIDWAPGTHPYKESHLAWLRGRRSAGCNLSRDILEVLEREKCSIDVKVEF